MSKWQVVACPGHDEYVRALLMNGDFDHEVVVIQPEDLFDISELPSEFLIEGLPEMPEIILETPEAEVIHGPIKGPKSSKGKNKYRYNPRGF